MTETQISQLNRITRLVGPGIVIAATAEFAPGMAVEVTAGYFQGRPGVVSDVRPSGTVVVLLHNGVMFYDDGHRLVMAPLKCTVTA